MRARFVTSILCVALLQSAAASADPQVPFVVGLTTVSAVSTASGDYEVLEVVDEIGHDSFKLVVSGEAPDDSGEIREITISRVVRFADLRTARTLRPYYHESDPPEFPGTSPLATSAMVSDLRANGKTSVMFLDVEPEFGMTVVKRKLSGSLARVGPGPVDVPVLVNGRREALHALHVAGRLADGADGDDFEFYILDDPENPQRLRSKGPSFSSSIIKIEFPQPKEAATSLERSLAEQRHALVYGIYFTFARADIRPASERTLRQIATALKNNPDWKLSIIGHTDNIGGDASNLNLSRQRAEAVKSALVERYAIAADRLTTGGYGASQPQEKNSTPEGRARNRRVELTRQ
jgi:outer membrane protein OmpA-like peptidoglycan-associated protein